MDRIEFVRPWLEPMAPIETGIEPKLSRIEGIRAVLFDLYGTLLLSAAGGGEPGAGKSVEPGRSIAPADPAVERILALPSLESGVEAIVARRHEEGRAEGRRQPEVEIREVWSEWLERRDLPKPDRETLESALLVHQCRVHPSAPMPGATEQVRGLHRAGLALGVISNAQFYTAILVEALLGLSLDGPEFDRELVFLSYREGEAKPSRLLHHRAAEALARRGIAPEETLYVGNDWAKDMLPSFEVGFRAAWFAGEARALRPGGEGIAACRDRADVVLTELGQLGEVLGLP